MDHSVSTAPASTPERAADPVTHIGWIAYHASRTPDRVAIVDLDGRGSTYGELDQRIRRLAGALAAGGVGPGDRVAVLAHNSPHVFDTLYACALLGAIMVPLNWRLHTTELAGIVGDCEPRAFLHDDAHAAVAEELTAAHPVGLRLGWTSEGPSSFQDALAEGHQPPAFATTSHAPWLIIYTSGTTALPKGVVHTVASVRATIENAVLCADVTSDSVCLSALPTFHVAGLHLFPNAVLQRGGRVVLMAQFDADRALSALWDPAAGITHFNGAPAMYRFMAGTERFRTGTPRPFVAAVGGSPVPAAMVDQWQGVGATVMAVYGITEGGATVLTTPLQVTTREASAVGVPALTVECQIRDDQGRHVVGEGVGELWLRGPAVMAGYWRRPADTAAVLDDDGWFRTGDAARVDGEGAFHIVDRWKDMFISGGENVYPAEVENVLYEHPQVFLATVIGVPDDKWGEVGRAFVVLAPGAGVDGEQLRAWCRERMAPYKVPAVVELVDDLPRNGTGKIAKAELRQQFSSLRDR